MLKGKLGIYFSSIAGNLEFAIKIVIAICISMILISILIDFLEYHKKDKVKFKKKSIVETTTMLLFLALIYLVISFRLGSVDLNNFSLRLIFVIIGLIILIFSTFFNIWGRLYLGSNWANQIKIYKDHKLITKGPYKIVRHPLYASIIWMFYASSLMYVNYLVFLLNSLVFIPFMFYRAKQEENLLKKNFKNYKKYRSKTGMFLPKIF